MSLSDDEKFNLIIRMLAQQQDLLHKLLNQRKDIGLKPARDRYRAARRIHELEIQLEVQKQAYDELAKFIEPKDLP